MNKAFMNGCDGQACDGPVWWADLLVGRSGSTLADLLVGRVKLADFLVGRSTGQTFRWVGLMSRPSGGQVWWADLLVGRSNGQTFWLAKRHGYSHHSGQVYWTSQQLQMMVFDAEPRDAMDQAMASWLWCWCLLGADEGCLFGCWWGVTVGCRWGMYVGCWWGVTVGCLWGMPLVALLIQATCVCAARPLFHHTQQHAPDSPLHCDSVWGMAIVWHIEWAASSVL